MSRFAFGMHLSCLLASIFGAIGAEAVVRGVNLGGWLVTEPWMTPSLYNATATVCEWDLCNILGKQKCKEQLEQHWSTFYTQQDFEQIKGAGLRYFVFHWDTRMRPALTMCNADAVRIPLGYWAVDLEDYEPYVSGQYPYLIKAVEWARDLGLKVFIDLHGAPGSQNGWEETGLVGPVLFSSNSSNSDRAVKVLGNLTQEFSQDVYQQTVTNIELLNEPLLSFPDLTAFYTAASNVVGPGNSSGINITISDGFLEPHTWQNYDPWNPTATEPAPSLTVDTHQFWAFPPLNTLSPQEILAAVCDFGHGLRNDSSIPPVLVGEWSLDSGFTANSTAAEGEPQDKRTWFRQLFEAQNAAFTPNGPGQSAVGWYFWSWKTEYDIDTWSYRKGLQYEWIPSNVSDPSSYAFPIKENGCIDASFKYEAPASTSSTTLAQATATGTGLAVSPTSPSGAGATGKSAACGLLVPGCWVNAWVLALAVLMVCLW